MTFLGSGACSILSVASDLFINCVSYFSSFLSPNTCPKELKGGFILRIQLTMMGRGGGRCPCGGVSTKLLAHLSVSWEAEKEMLVYRCLFSLFPLVQNPGQGMLPSMLTSHS